MPLFESQAVVPVHRYSHAALFFPGDLVGPEALLRSAASCIIFSGLDAGTPPPPPPPPLDPLVLLVLLVPLVLAAVVILYFPGWRSSIPALAKKIVCSGYQLQLHARADPVILLLKVVCSRPELPRCRCVPYCLFRAKGPFRLRGQTVNFLINTINTINLIKILYIK